MSITQPKHKHINHFSKLALCVLLMVSWFATHATALAAPSSQSVVTSVSQQDLNQDGIPDLAIINTSFNTANDQIRVYDGGHNMRSSTDWHEATDFKDDTWVFDRAADGSAQLVIRFATTEDTTTATLFSDQNKDGKVDVSVQGMDVTITEPLFSPMQIIVQGDWLLPNGDLNWNVRFLTDGPFLYFLNGSNVSDHWSRNGYFVFDGKPDAELVFADSNHDGIPEYGMYRVIGPTPSTDGATRTLIWSNEDNQRPAQPQHFIFWPYLSESLPININPEAELNSKNNYFDTSPFLSYSFNAAGIRLLAFEGYPIEQGFHVNTLQYFRQEQLNSADFENAMSYYDLADDHDGFPELHIRNRYFGKDDPYNSNISVPTDEIRYSWNQLNNTGPSWDYKLGLVSNEAITYTNEIGGFRYTGVPYSLLPAWVTHNHWDYATFVAREDVQILSAEGIYVWAPLERFYNGSTTILSRYLAGEITLNIDDAFPDIGVGVRGDFAPELAAQARLYFSPIDHKLHLMNARNGVWHINANTWLHYTNLGSSPYLDQLTYTQVITEPQAYTVTRQLSIAPSHLLYGDGKDVYVRQAQVTPSLFETLAPANHDEWLTLGQQLEHNKSEIMPDDLRAMMQQFAGPEMHIRGAEISDYRPIGTTGFRFILNLATNSSIEGTDLLGLRSQSGDAYAVIYDGKFHIVPLTAPAITAAISADSFTQWQAGGVRINLDNQGLLDVSNATLEMLAARNGGEPTTVATRTITLLSDIPNQLSIPWTPNTPGDWSLTFRILHPDWDNLLSQQYTLTVNPATISTEQIVLANDSPLFASLAGLVLIGICVLGGAIFWLQLGWTRRRQVPNER